MTLIGPRPTSRRRSAAAAGLATVLALTAGCGGGPATDEQGRAIATISTASHSMAAAPVLAGLALDTYRAEGIALEDVPAGASSSNVVSAVLSGDAEFGFVGATAAVDAIQKGAPITIVGGLTYGMQELVLGSDVAKRLAPATPRSPVAQRVQSLRGLTIATSPPGSANNAFLSGILSSQGLDPARDVTIVPADPAAIVAGVRDGLYDGGFWSPGVLEQNLADGSGQMWVNTAAGDLPAFNECFQGFTIASKRTVAAEPELVEKFMRGSRAASARIRDDEAATQTAVHDRFFPQVDRATFDLAWRSAKPSFDPDQQISEKEFADHLDLQRSLFGATYDQVGFADAVHPLAKRQG